MLYGGVWFEGKIALVRHITAQGVLSATEARGLLFPSLTEDLRERIDYFCDRAVRLRALGADPAPVATNGMGGSAAAIGGLLAALAGVFAAQHDELNELRGRPTAGERGDIAPVVRHLEEYRNQLARMAARLAALERIEDEKRQGLADQAEMVTVILRKVGQIAHDLEQTRSRGSSVPRHTRQRPLGTE